MKQQFRMIAWSTKGQISESDEDVDRQTMGRAIGDVKHLTEGGSYCPSAFASG